MEPRRISGTSGIGYGPEEPTEAIRTRQLRVYDGTICRRQKREFWGRVKDVLGIWRAVNRHPARYIFETRLT
jgi:hypothetical protein